MTEENNLKYNYKRISDAFLYNPGVKLQPWGSSLSKYKAYYFYDSIGAELRCSRETTDCLVH